MRKIWHLLKFRLKTFLLVCLLAVPLASCQNVGKHTNLTPEEATKDQTTTTAEMKATEDSTTPPAEESKKEDQETQAEVTPAESQESVAEESASSEEPGQEEKKTAAGSDDTKETQANETEAAKSGDDKKVEKNGIKGEYNDFRLYKVFTPDQYMYVHNFPDLVMTKDDPKTQIHRQVRMTFLPTENMNAVMKSIKDVAKVETNLPWRGGEVQVLKMQPARPEDIEKNKKKAKPTVDPNHPELQMPTQGEATQEDMPDPIFLIFSSVTKTSSMAFYYTGTGITVDDPEVQAIYENIQFNTSKLDQAVEEKLRKKD